MNFPVAQISPLMQVQTKDINQDGHLDLLVAGNFFASETETVRYDAGSGLILLGKGNGDFSPLSFQKSGLLLTGDVKDCQFIKLAQGGNGLLVTQNNDYLELWQQGQN